MKLKKLLLGLCLVSLVGCSSQSTSSSNSTDTHTLKHALGTIEVVENPENVVAIAWGNPDVPLALGIVPTGVSEANFGPRDKNGLLPWTAEAFEELDAKPNVFSDTDGWDYEAISDANPDVILAAYSGLTEEDYDRLSEIAPVMAYPNMPWATTWREETIQNAKALNKEKEGQELVDEVDALIAEKLKDYPELEGKSTAFLWLSEDDLGTFYAYTTLDPRANFLNDLGLTTPESIQSLATDTDFSVTISAENADQLSDVDIIITYGDESLIEALKKDGRYANIPAVQNEAIVLLDNNDKLAAASTPTVLSIPYCIDDYLAALHEAAVKVQ